MSILSAPKLYAQQRLDLEDMNVLFTGIETDWKYFIDQFFAPTGFILGGFNVSGLGGPSPALITVANSTLINPDNTGCFSFFSGTPTDAPLSASLTPSSRNYVELELSTQDGTPLTRAFWDPSAQGGLGAEFNQTVNTVTNLSLSAVVLSGGFSGNPNRIPVAIIDTDGGNNVKLIIDKRPLFFRLGTTANPQADYAWGSREEPEMTLSLSGVAGTFLAGEAIMIGTANATVQTGGTTTVGVIYTDSDAYAAGNSVVGQTSGATGTLVQATSQFTGADKSINNIREMLAAFATEIKAIKGTKIWSADAGVSLQDIIIALEQPAYDEFIAIVASGATGNQLNGPVTASTVIDLPLNSRLAGTPQQFYEVGKGQIALMLNGQNLQLGLPDSWAEVGSSGSQSMQITILQQLEVGDVLTFRENGLGGPGGGGGGGGGAPDDDFHTLPSSNNADNADYLLIWDDSAGAYRKQLRSVFLAGLTNSVNVNTYTANRAINATSDDVVLMDCTSGALSASLPNPATCPGKKFDIKKIDNTANVLTIDGVSVNIDNAFTKTTSTPFQSLSVVSDGIQYWAI